MIIDFHIHTFPEKIAGKTIEKLQALSRSMPYTDATEKGLIASMKEAGIDYSVNLPVATAPRQVEKLNTIAIAALEHVEETGVIPFGAVHPDFEDYKTEFKRLRAAGVKGVKIHPAYQNVDLNDIRFKRMIDAASEEDLIVLSHCGWDIGIPQKDFCSVPMILDIVNEVKPAKFVCAHMGGWTNWKEVKTDLAGAPVFFDTAFSVGEIRPAPGTSRGPEESQNMSPEVFTDLVRALGTEKVLFATDCPWSSQKEYVELFKGMDFTDEERKQIMGENAAKLLGM